MWENGKQYIGEWKEGKQHGKGKIMLMNGEKKEGEWENGKRIRWINE